MKKSKRMKDDELLEKYGIKSIGGSVYREGFLDGLKWAIKKKVIK